MAEKSTPGCAALMEIRERASATVLLFPAMCLIHVVYSDIAVRCRCCLADQGSEILAKAKVRGEIAALQEITETPHCKVKGKLTIKSAILPLSRSELSAEEGQWLP